MLNVNAEDLDWGKLRSVGGIDEAVLPVAIQDVHSGQVLMVAYTSRASLAETLESGQVVLYSTSKRALHRKGETSRDVLRVVDVSVNCEANSLLLRVQLEGDGACHVPGPTGVAHLSCFHRRLVGG